VSGPKQTWDADELQALLDVCERAAMEPLDVYVHTDEERAALDKLRDGAKFYASEVRRL
jgi:hypothetical protein